MTVLLRVYVGAEVDALGPAVGGGGMIGTVQG